VIVDRRIVVCVVLSVAAHVAFADGMRRLPRRQDAPSKRLVSIRVVSPPPAPEPPPEPATPTPVATPKAAPRALARARPTPSADRPVIPKEVPPPDSAPPPGDSVSGPVFGVSMESTSQAGGGPALPIGSPVRPSGAGGGEKQPSKSAGEPVEAYEVTSMPMPQGRCTAKYTDEAKQAGIEGTVVLGLVVSADGRATEIHVVSGLDHGLTAAAIAALKACRFSPGQKNGVPVPVRIREFKVRFLSNDE
jgi:TonB family protein